MAKVRLREWRLEDAAAITPMLADPHLRHWSSLPGLGSAAWIAAQRRSARGPSLAICRAGEDRALGKIALRLPGHTSSATADTVIRRDERPAGELSYWVLPAARGQGLAGAAVGLMLPRARAAGCASVALDIEADNLGSLRVAQHLGAERREPTRVETDREGVARTLVVHVLTFD